MVLLLYTLKFLYLGSTLHPPFLSCMLISSSNSIFHRPLHFLLQTSIISSTLHPSLWNFNTEFRSSKRVLFILPKQNSTSERQRGGSNLKEYKKSDAIVYKLLFCIMVHYKTAGSLFPFSKTLHKNKPLIDTIVGYHEVRLLLNLDRPLSNAKTSLQNVAFRLVERTPPSISRQLQDKRVKKLILLDEGLYSSRWSGCGTDVKPCAQNACWKSCGNASRIAASVCARHSLEKRRVPLHRDRVCILLAANTINWWQNYPVHSLIGEKNFLWKIERRASTEFFQWYIVERDN